MKVNDEAGVVSWPKLAAVNRNAFLQRTNDIT